MVATIGQSLLGVDITHLSSSRSLILNLRLPCLSAGQEHFLHFLEGLACSLGEHEEDMDNHGGKEDTKQDVHLPLNVDKGRWNEVRKCEIKDPVRRSAERDCFASNSERKELWRIDP